MTDQPDKPTRIVIDSPTNPTGTAGVDAPSPLQTATGTGPTTGQATGTTRANAPLSPQSESSSVSSSAPGSAPPAPPAGPPPALSPPPSDPTPWAARRFILTGSLVIALLVGGLGGWATFTQIAGAIVSTGQIEVDRNRQVVQHLDGGIVAEILVDEGDTVETDQVLIRLDGTLLRSELAVVENQYFELVSRRGRLEAERDGLDNLTFDEELVATAAQRPDVASLMDGQQRLFEARTESLDKEIEQLGKRRGQIDNQIDGIIAQQDALGIQLDLLRDELTDQTGLMDKGLAQKSRVLSLQREEARLAGTLGELTASLAESQGRITELDIEILKLRTQRREEAITRLRDLQYRELELAEQRRALRERARSAGHQSPGLGSGLRAAGLRRTLGDPRR